MRAWLFSVFRSLCGAGLVLGTLFMAASLTPTLVPRSPVLQGALSGVCLAAGYGLGVALRGLWRALGWPELKGRPGLISLGVLLALCLAGIGASLWWADTWQNRLRALMQMAPIDSAGPFTIALVALAVFALLLSLALLFRRLRQWLARHFKRRVPTPTATLLALVLTALVFWNLGNGVLVKVGLRVLDSSYSELDARLEEERPQPTQALK
ncbi:MAG: hypothetical protein EOO29_53335, partial [Comamonadaceae bacterium]